VSILSKRGCSYAAAPAAAPKSDVKWPTKPVIFITRNSPGAGGDLFNRAVAIGTFSINNPVFDIGTTLFFGVVGYFMTKIGGLVMVLDLGSCPVIDNHSHPLEHEKANLSPEWLAREFFHGMGDTPIPGVRAKLWGTTDELQHHFPYMGVAQTMVCQLARVFGCPAELEAVAAERNRRTSESFSGYIRLLYDDAGIVGTVLDTGLPVGDPVLDLFPGRVMRLFQMTPALQGQIKQCDSYQEALRGFQAELDRAVRVDRFVGVKAHLAEEVGLGAEPVSEAEAARVFPAAKAGDPEAYKKLYVALFWSTMVQCQELEVPMHIHTGMTGGLWDGPLSDADPFLLVPMLKRPEYLKTRLVLLHGAHPWFQHAGAMAHTFPHVWVDMGQITPWLSLRIAECYRDVIGMAPLDKIMIGSGSHGTPEPAWLAGITAKIALGEVLGDAVRMGLMTQSQGEHAGRMILHDNAARLYGLE
jgi:uncharacterized protein